MRIRSIVSSLLLILFAGIPFSGQTQNGFLDFDGVDDYVDIPETAPNGMTQLTVEAWMRPLSLGNMVVWGKQPFGPHQYLGVTGTQAGGRISTTQGGTFTSVNLVGGAPLVIGQWVHIAMVYDGSEVRLYKDGVGVDTMAISGPLTTVAPLDEWIGKRGTTNFFHGQIDEVRVWGVPRTQADIQASMNVELTGGETGLRAYYNFNQGTCGGANAGVTTLTDATSNNRNGTLSATFALSGCASNWVCSGATCSIPYNGINNPMNIPTMGQWGLISLGLLILCLGAVYLRRRTGFQAA